MLILGASIHNLQKVHSKLNHSTAIFFNAAYNEQRQLRLLFGAFQAPRPKSSAREKSLRLEAITLPKMACSRCSLLLARVPDVSVLVNRTLCTSTSLYTSKNKPPPPLRKWGLERFPRDPTNKTGPLTDLPDYTYLDGRPTPLNKGQLKRKKENYELAKRIVTLVQEMEGAKEKYARKQQEEVARREAILAAKLKQKSDEL
ncbi:hypothetical protein BaRGS_00036132 [Batillaria attramentaria]|uniref:Large ribosomal subunit protein mL52 n=1 Tax=Batillaria attramentaria TaxID=370345 RepID=A0ABD0JCG3_9CAEN